MRSTKYIYWVYLGRAPDPSRSDLGVGKMLRRDNNDNLLVMAHPLRSSLAVFVERKSADGPTD